MAMMVSPLFGHYYASREHLEVGGWLLIEHGYDQAASVAKLMAGVVLAM